MKPIDFRAASDREKHAGELVLAFFDALGGGHFDAARALTAAGFTWFEHAVPTEAWDRFQAEIAAVSNARVVPEALRPEDDREGVLVLVDVASPDQEATAAVVVLGERIVRVFDPRAVREYLSEF